MEFPGQGHRVIRAGIGIIAATGIATLAAHSSEAPPRLEASDISVRAEGANVTNLGTAFDPEALLKGQLAGEQSWDLPTTTTTEAPSTTIPPNHSERPRASRNSAPRVIVASTPETTEVQVQAQSSNTSQLRSIGNFYLTCYDLNHNRTATGTRVHNGTFAVDPRVIPLGTKLQIEGVDGAAEDTGGAVHGRHIDVWKPSCNGWGNHTATVFIIERAAAAQAEPTPETTTTTAPPEETTTTTSTPPETTTTTTSDPLV